MPFWSYKNERPKLGSHVFIASTAALIGDVVIGDDSSVWFGCTLRGDVNNIIIGKRSNIQDGTVIHVSSTGQGTYIGDDVTVGHQALLHACTVEDECFIGMQACLMDDVFVETGAMIAAGALVTPGKRIPSGELWAGRPAKKMRDLTAEESAHITYSAGHYVRLADEYFDKCDINTAEN